MKSQHIAKSFAAFLAKKIGATQSSIEDLMSGLSSEGFTAEVIQFADHAAKTISAFNSGFLKQSHVNEIFSDIEYLGIK